MKGNSDYDEVVASHWQVAQVSAISITNFLGRILIGLPSSFLSFWMFVARILTNRTGLTSDFTTNHFHFPRSYCISLVAFLFIISQLIIVGTDDVKDLWKASLALGLAYGGLFGLFPTIMLEWFGIGA